ncbi:hypothetical protein D9619_013529 [Psilocybe cf. subviscida]|uniref:Uncharacterized protein n=1 Tax=Psilocybe cf. subviscida TaxID=2480587 RepID=A0A8H5BHP7_9AGAR|nr:hypothetical protein D9619_013529 [Psilocybe cf. subviscida]
MITQVSRAARSRPPLPPHPQVRRPARCCRGTCHNTLGSSSDPAAPTGVAPRVFRRQSMRHKPPPPPPYVAQQRSRTPPARLRLRSHSRPHLRRLAKRRNRTLHQPLPRHRMPETPRIVSSLPLVISISIIRVIEE